MKVVINFLLSSRQKIRGACFLKLLSPELSYSSRKLSLNFSFQSNWGTKKKKVFFKNPFNSEIITDPSIEEILAPLRLAVMKQVC